MANPDVIITPGDGKIEFSGSSAGDSNSSKIRVGGNGDLHMEGSDLFVSGNLHVSGALLTADGTSPDPDLFDENCSVLYHIQRPYRQPVTQKKK